MLMLLLNEHGNPSFLFQNLSSCNINNQKAKFDKNLRAGSISYDSRDNSCMQCLSVSIDYLTCKSTLRYHPNCSRLCYVRY